jgi:hypothetical protein
VHGVEVAQGLDDGEEDAEPDGGVAGLDAADGRAAEVRAFGELVDAEVLLLAEGGELRAQLGRGASRPYGSGSRGHDVRGYVLGRLRRWGASAHTVGMLSRTLSSARIFAPLAVVTLVVPTAVLGLRGMFQDWSTEEAPTVSWAMVAWLVGPYVVFAALLVGAGRASNAGFRIAVSVVAVVVVLQSVLLVLMTPLASDEALGSVGVLAMPVFQYGGAAVLAVAGLVLHLTGRRGAVGAAARVPVADGSHLAR